MYITVNLKVDLFEKMRSMWHYRNRPLMLIDVEAAIFKNINDAACNFNISPYTLHKHVMKGTVNLVYIDKCASVDNNHYDADIGDNKRGIPKNSSRKRCREEADESNLRTPRMRID